MDNGCMLIDKNYQVDHDISLVSVFCGGDGGGSDRGGGVVVE